MKLTLGKSIVLLLVGILIGTALLLGSVAFFTTRDSIVNLRRDLLKQVDERVQQRMQAYFDRAGPAIEFLETAVFPDPGVVEADAGDWEDKARLLNAYLKTEPDIVWIYYAEESTGYMLGCNIDPRGRFTITRIHPDKGRIAEGFVVGKDGSLAPVELVPRNPNPYDPRLRPWYSKATSNEGMVWTPPYGFLSSRIVGITAARARRAPDGEVLGVFGADLELGRLGAFLDEFEIGEDGAAFLMLEGGASVVPVSARNNPNVAVLQGAIEGHTWDFTGLEIGMTQEERFSHEKVDYISLVQPINIPGPTRYYAAVIVPRTAYLDIVYRNLLLTVALGAVILALAIGLGVRQARRVTEPLARISEELDSIGNLRFRESELEVDSNIHEVASFSDSVGKMKVSLRAFSRYVPRDLVRLLLSRGDEANLGGVLRKVTVVFTDLAGFTAYSESLTPDEAFSELSKFLEVVADCQEKRGGITSSFTGDGTLALFNAPEEQSGHETAACLSALEILAALDRLNRKRRNRGLFEFHARIGINTADVLLGNLGTRERFAYTAIGDGVNLASRLEGLSKLYGTEILVGVDCREAIGEAVEWRLVDRIAVVGRKQATEIYEPLGIPGEVEEEILEARDFYESALRDYFEGKLPEALEGFRKASLALPSDEAARVLSKRCEHYREVGLPGDWNGTYIARVK